MIEGMGGLDCGGGGDTAPWQLISTPVDVRDATFVPWIILIFMHLFSLLLRGIVLLLWLIAELFSGADNGDHDVSATVTCRSDYRFVSCCGGILDRQMYFGGNSTSVMAMPSVLCNTDTDNRVITIPIHWWCMIFIFSPRRTHF